jgi:photosystem II PsbM protein
MNWFDRSNIHNIELIQYYQNASPPLEFTGIPLFSLHGITSRVIVKKKKEVMEVNILAFIATALFVLVPTAFLLIIYVKTASQND